MAPPISVKQCEINIDVVMTMAERLGDFHSGDLSDLHKQKTTMFKGTPSRFLQAMEQVGLVEVAQPNVEKPRWLRITEKLRSIDIQVAAEEVHPVHAAITREISAKSRAKKKADIKAREELMEDINRRRGKQQPELEVTVEQEAQETEPQSEEQVRIQRYAELKAEIQEHREQLGTLSRLQNSTASELSRLITEVEKLASLVEASTQKIIDSRPNYYPAMQRLMSDIVALAKYKGFVLPFTSIRGGGNGVEDKTEGHPKEQSTWRETLGIKKLVGQ